MFPHGDLGFHVGIPLVNLPRRGRHSEEDNERDRGRRGRRQTVTPLQFYR